MIKNPAMPTPATINKHVPTRPQAVGIYFAPPAVCRQNHQWGGLF